MGKHRDLLLIASLLGGMCFFAACDRSNDDAIQSVPAKIGKSGKVYSNFTAEWGKSNTKNFSEEVGDIVPGQPVTVMEFDGWDRYKVQLPDGTMGWLDGEYLEPSKHTFVKHTAPSTNRHIASNRGAIGAARKIVKEVNKKTAVTRLEEIPDPERSANSIDWTKVRTDDGIEGWIMSNYLYPVIMDPVRYINRKEWHYGMDSFKKKWIDEPLEKFEKKYKEPSGIKISDRQKICYFNNIYLFKDTKEYYSIRVHAIDGVIKDIDAATRRTSWVGYMPLSSLLRINVLANYLGNWQYILEDDTDLNKESFDMKDHLPSWLYWIVVLLIFLLMLAILFFVLKVPYYIVNKWTYKQSLNRDLFNRRIMTYAVLGSVILGYTYYVLMVANFFPFNKYFFITTLFCLGMILGNISKWRNDLDYNRCNREGCHQWTGQDNGTEFLGGSIVTQTITYNNGATEKNKQTIRKYRDHRKCSACGNEWSIIRTEVFGRLKF